MISRRDAMKMIGWVMGVVALLGVGFTSCSSKEQKVSEVTPVTETEARPTVAQSTVSKANLGTGSTGRGR